jgi:hypothetical protein
MDTVSTSPPLAASTPPLQRALAAVRSVCDATGLPVGYLLCAPLALFAIWGHHFVPGIDLPHHAELVRIWVELRKGTPDIVNLYELKTLTPYTLAYVLAYPVAVLAGPMAGIKFVLTVAALGVPWMMSRWLRVVGGDHRLGVIGFPVVFGWAFIWGFLSHCLALVFMFAYLTAVEEGGQRPSVLQIVETICWGGVLFFCHGVTFGLAMVCAGARIVLRPRPLAMWRAVLHFIPLGVLTLYWMHLQEKAVEDKPGPWFMDWGRLKILFSGFFCVQVNTFWAEVVFGVLVVLAIFTLPRINWRPAAWVPFLVAVACFVILPSHIVATELIGPRFSVYVQALSVGIWLARPGRWDRHFEWAANAVAIVCLVVLNVRIARFNKEMKDFTNVAAKAVPGSDIQTFMPNSGGGSETWGYRAMATSAAWYAAEHGGILDDDYAARFNMPVQRRKGVSFPHRYRFIFTTADAAKVKKQFPDAQVRATSGKFSLYERVPQKYAGFDIVRSGEGWGELRLDKSCVETPLSVAGQTYEHGLGTHADSWIELRAAPGRTIEGECGLDDSGRDEAKIACSARSLSGMVFFRSPILRKGTEPYAFKATFPPDGILLLEVHNLAVNKGTHADWLNLR